MSTATMLKKFSMAAIGAAAVALGTLGQTGSAQATTLTFDDLPATYLSVEIADGYGELNWDNFYYANAAWRPGEGFDKGKVSGKYIAFNGNGDPTAVSSKNAFDFNSAYLTPVWNNDDKITVEGLYNGQSKYKQTVAVNNAGPTKFDFNFLGIDQLKFSSFKGYFAMDNFTFNPTEMACR